MEQINKNRRNRKRVLVEILGLTTSEPNNIEEKLSASFYAGSFSVEFKCFCFFNHEKFDEINTISVMLVLEEDFALHKADLHS